MFFSYTGVPLINGSDNGMVDFQLTKIQRLQQIENVNVMTAYQDSYMDSLDDLF